MRYAAAEKAEIIKLVEQSHLSARQTLDRIGVSRSTFYRWYDLYQMGGPDALEDKPSKPSRVWNRIPQPIHDQIIEMALEESELSPRELAVRFTETKRYFVSEASVYRLLKAHNLITSPAFIVNFNLLPFLKIILELKLILLHALMLASYLLGVGLMFTLCLFDVCLD